MSEMAIATQHDVDGLTATAFDLNAIDGRMDGYLYLSSCPGYSEVDGAGEDRKAAHLAFLFDEGIHQVVTLTPEDERRKLGVADMPQRIIGAGCDWLEVPVVNFGTPEKGEMRRFTDMIDDASQRLKAGQKVLVHCRGGIGRAGKVGALLMMRGGMEADLAISTLRKHRPGCVQTAKQEDFVRAYDGNLPGAS
jgi:protein-tyrosine phosphatase